MRTTIGWAFAAALVWTGTAFAQQGLGSAPGPNPPPPDRTAPGVDTGGAAPSRQPLTESSTPGATDATGSVGSALNPEGNPSGTIDAGPRSAIDAGASGRNTCYPGQSGQQVGSTNPAGMASQCK